VHILGITADPGGPRTVHQIRNLLMDLDDRAAGFRCLVRDRAGQFNASLDAALADAGIQVVKVPARSPRANAYAQRFVLTHCPGRGHRPDALLRANGICRRSWLSMSPIATAGDLIAADSYARPGPTTLSRTSPRSGSGDGLSSAASSTSTSESHGSPGQDWRPRSPLGTIPISVR
jgi:hypothetical protein